MTGKIKTGIVVVCVGIVAGAIGWHKLLRDELFPKNFGVVEHRKIFRSGQLTERMFQRVVTDHNIRTVIALNGNDPAVELEKTAAQNLGIGHVTFSLIGDGTGNPADYAKVVNMMADPELQPVLVHCAAGAQRTSTSVVLYRHLVQGVPISEAYPESFEFKHKADEWKLLAYLADYVDDIEAEFDRLRQRNSNQQ